MPALKPLKPLKKDELARIDAWWRAANYLSVGQIYLLDNPLLREPLQPEHVKPRLLGHWGTTPGLNLIYAHLNRVIGRDDLNAIYITGNPFAGIVTEMALFSPGPSIYGGTDEIQHNIVGERVLGLPKEPNNDKVTAFKDLPKNG